MTYNNNSLNQETTNAIAFALAAEPQYVSAKAGLIDAPLVAQKSAERALISEHSTEGSSSCIVSIIQIFVFLPATQNQSFINLLVNPSRYQTQNTSTNNQSKSFKACNQKHAEAQLCLY